MTNIPALHPTLGAWLLEGPLSAHVPAYTARLRRGRYATHTSERCLNAVAHFAHWMSMCHLPARMLDEGCIDQFLRCHLPRCDCLGGALRTPSQAHAALVPMLEILRVEAVIARPPVPVGRIADELRSYDAHMRDARGLVSGTRTDRLRIVERPAVTTACREGLRMPARARWVMVWRVRSLRRVKSVGTSRLPGRAPRVGRWPAPEASMHGLARTSVASLCGIWRSCGARARQSEVDAWPVAAVAGDRPGVVWVALGRCMGHLQSLVMTSPATAVQPFWPNRCGVCRQIATSQLNEAGMAPCSSHAAIWRVR